MSNNARWQLGRVSQSYDNRNCEKAHLDTTMLLLTMPITGAFVVPSMRVEHEHEKDQHVKRDKIKEQKAPCVAVREEEV